MIRSAPNVILSKSEIEQLQAEMEALKQRIGAKLPVHARMRTYDPDSTATNEIAFEIARLRTRLLQLQEAWEHVILAADQERSEGTVGVGSRVKVRWEGGQQKDYTIVRLGEVDPRAGQISYESPVGLAMLGRRPGDRVEVIAPGGRRWLTVLAVEQRGR